MRKLLLVIFYFFIFTNPTIALVEVDITRGNLEPLPIAVSPFHLESGSQIIKQGDEIIKNIGEELAKIILKAVNLET